MSLNDLGGIDEIIHGRIRLGIMVYLADVDVADFTELKTALDTTQGNLSTHLTKLEDAGYVESRKRFVNKKPQTTLRLTEAGSKAFANYVETLGSLLGKQTGRKS